MTRSQFYMIVNALIILTLPVALVDIFGSITPAQFVQLAVISARSALIILLLALLGDILLNRSRR